MTVTHKNSSDCRKTCPSAQLSPPRAYMH